MKRKLGGGLVGIIGFLLSPLSWWNDLLINVPLALGFAFLASYLWPQWFLGAFIVGYWLTNVLGLVMLHNSGKMIWKDEPVAYTRRDLIKDVGLSVVYTLVVAGLILSGVIKPLPDYFPAASAP